MTTLINIFVLIGFVAAGFAAVTLIFISIELIRFILMDWRNNGKK